MTYRVPETRCPYCDAQLNAVDCIDADKAMPTPGDLTLCFTCAQALEFDLLLVPQRITEARLQRIYSENPAFARDFQIAQRHLRDFDRKSDHEKRSAARQSAATEGDE